MKAREVTPAHFPNLAATLFADRTVIAFTPATSELPWAADVTWAAARAVAHSGRRVALFDLSLEQPVLHHGAADTIEEGVVDAFVFGVSLGHVAREQAPDLHFIGVGTRPTEPDEVWSSTRWQRLARGFQQEGALLLLFVPPAALPKLGVEIEGLVVLSPTGYAAVSLSIAGIGERLGRGTSLLSVVRRDRPTPRPTPSGQPRPPFALGTPRRRSGSRTVLVAAGLILGLLVTAAWLLLRGSQVSPGDNRGLSVPPAAEAQRPAPVPARPGDSLFYSVQVAAFNQQDQASAYARRFDGAAGAATVSPVRVGRQSLWYRVVVGVLPTPTTADSLLRVLWRKGAVERPNGTILRTPQAYALGRAETIGAAGELIEGLRQRGVAAYIVPAPDGSVQVLTGAFEAPDQARAADSLLRRAGLTGKLVQRMGTRP